MDWCFSLFDIDFDGFQSALSTCEIDIKKEKLSKILESYDTGEDEMMEFEKFLIESHQAAQHGKKLKDGSVFKTK